MNAAPTEPTTPSHAPDPSGTGGPGPGNADWSTPPPPPSSSRTGVVVAASVVVLALLAVAMVLLAVDATSQQRTERFDDVTAVTLDLDNADVELLAGTDEAVVDSRVRTGRVGGRHSAEVRDGTLRVDYDCPFFNGLLFGLGCGGEYRLAIPPGVEVTGHTGNGEVRASGLDGRLDLHTSNGEIHVDDTSGVVTAETSNGDVSATNLASTDVQVITSNGGVVLGFATAPDRARVETSNGTVEVVVPDDGTSYAVDSSTSNGEVVTSVPTDPSSSRQLLLRTSNGDVVVRSS